MPDDLRFPCRTQGASGQPQHFRIILDQTQADAGIEDVLFREVQRPDPRVIAEDRTQPCRVINRRPFGGMDPRWSRMELADSGAQGDLGAIGDDAAEPVCSATIKVRVARRSG